MPETVVSASPSPASVLAATGPSAAGKPAAEAAAANGSPDSQSGTPFAAVLQKQMSQPAEPKTAAAPGPDKVGAVLDVVPATDGAETPKTDAVAFLAPMLAGLMAGGKSAEGKELGRGAKPDNKDDKTAPDAVIAAPLVAPVLTTDIATRKDTNTEGAGDGAGLPLAAASADKLARNAAILAADKAAVGDAAEQTGKTRTSAPGEFDALLRQNDAAAALSQAADGAHNAREAAASATAIPTAEVRTPVGTRGWDGEVGDKVVWMVNRNESRAELVLNPPHLGRVEVTLSVNGDQANAVFVAASPAVREALENAVPRLREQLQDAGITLGQAQVGAESFQQSAGSRENGDNSGRNGGGGREPGFLASDATPGASPSQARWQRSGNGLVDTFA